MKQTLLIGSALAAKPLIELQNQGEQLLNQLENLTPLERLAHIATFDEIPIFGGEELRAKMLQATNEAKDLDLLDKINLAVKTVGCSMDFALSVSLNMLKGNKDRLEYASFCDTISGSTLRASETPAEALQ